GGNEYHYQTIVINCTDPDLKANTLDVNNGANLNTLTSAGRISALAGIEGDGTKPLRVHQPAGLKVDAALDVGEYGGQATFRREVTVAGITSLNGNTTAKSLTVNGNLTVDPGSAGYAWIKSGRLDVNSAANFNAYGTTNLKTTNVAAGSTFTTNGDFTAAGKVNIFQDPIEILRTNVDSSHSWTAPTDGFLMVTNSGGDGYFRAQITGKWAGSWRNN
ncbi:hypothetical protein, partial [Streptomyces lavendulae]|uniref:hypothetical protein n=1 Tax=Streptomyces lavendulae TaxID=1914 RepID=UPI0031E80A1C